MQKITENDVANVESIVVLNTNFNMYGTADKPCGAGNEYIHGGCS